MSKRRDRDVFDEKTAKVRVAYKRCDQCLFSKNKVVSDAARADILQKCRKKDTAFVCHKASKIRLAVVCRGFFDEERNTACQIARAMDAVAFLDPETGKPAGKPFNPSEESYVRMGPKRAKRASARRRA